MVTPPNPSAGIIAEPGGDFVAPPSVPVAAPPPPPPITKEPVLPGPPPPPGPLPPQTLPQPLPPPVTSSGVPILPVAPSPPPLVPASLPTSFGTGESPQPAGTAPTARPAPGSTGPTGAPTDESGGTGTSGAGGDDYNVVNRQLVNYNPDLSGLPEWGLLDPFGFGFESTDAAPLAGGGAVRVIAQACSDYGVDALAAIANALHEGASGLIGDGGTAYGPFQIHAEDGRLAQFVGKPKNSNLVNGWAWSANGLQYAVRSMVNGHPSARGLLGHVAVLAIIQGFEKPHDEHDAYNKRAAEYDHLVSLGAQWATYAASKFLGPAAGGGQDTGLGNPGPVKGAGSAGVNQQWRGMLSALFVDVPGILEDVRAQGDRFVGVFR